MMYDHQTVDTVLFLSKQYLLEQQLQRYTISVFDILTVKRINRGIIRAFHSIEHEKLIYSTAVALLYPAIIHLILYTAHLLDKDNTY